MNIRQVHLDPGTVYNIVMQRLSQNGAVRRAFKHGDIVDGVMVMLEQSIAALVVTAIDPDMITPKQATLYIRLADGELIGCKAGTPQPTIVSEYWWPSSMPKWKEGD